MGGSTLVTDDRVRRPSLALLALEGPRAVGELGLLAGFQPLLRQAPRGDGHPVLVLPGLLADDRSTVPLRRFLRRLGYHVHGWSLGRNVPSERVRAGLAARIQGLVDRHGSRRISLVGWSLGGIYARQIALVVPDSVRQVITLGSPFAESPGEESHPGAVMRRLFGDRPPPRLERGPLPVPSTAIFTRSDGVVPWRASRGKAGPQSESIEVVASHCGLGFHPAVLWAVADRLAQPEGAWAPFRPTPPWSVLYPSRDAESP
ncbi:MAG: esterase/lipase family protein [Acidimicrobiales bacterium]